MSSGYGHKSADKKRDLLIKEFLQEKTSYFSIEAKFQVEEEKNLSKLVRQEKEDNIVLSGVVSPLKSRAMIDYSLGDEEATKKKKVSLLNGQ